jgi:hypothetical protein
MKKSLLLFLFIFFAISLQAQKDTVNFPTHPVQKNASTEASVNNLSIYPIPVRDNYFNIRCDKEISFVKVTNIIGQDIFKKKYTNSETIIKITLDNPKRGMYLVTIIFSDGARIVKKIMIEQIE